MRDRIASMDFSTHGTDDEIVVATVTGDIDSSNASDLRRAIYERVSPSAEYLIIDFTAASYLDSAGIELIFELARRLTARRQTLRIVSPPGSGIRRILDLCAVSAVADVVDTRDEALEAVA